MQGAAFACAIGGGTEGMVFIRPRSVRTSQAEATEPPSVEDHRLTAGCTHPDDVGDDQQVVPAVELAIDSAVDPPQSAVNSRRALGRKGPVNPGEFVAYLPGESFQDTPLSFRQQTDDEFPGPRDSRSTQRSSINTERDEGRSQGQRGQGSDN